MSHALKTAIKIALQSVVCLAALLATQKEANGENQTKDIKEQPHTLTNQSLTTVLAQIPDTAKPSSAGREELTHWTA